MSNSSTDKTDSTDKIDRTEDSTTKMVIEDLDNNVSVSNLWQVAEYDQDLDRLEDNQVEYELDWRVMHYGECPHCNKPIPADLGTGRYVYPIGANEEDCELRNIIDTIKKLIEEKREEDIKEYVNTLFVEHEYIAFNSDYFEIYGTGDIGFDTATSIHVQCVYFRKDTKKKQTSWLIAIYPDDLHLETGGIKGGIECNE